MAATSGNNPRGGRDAGVNAGGGGGGPGTADTASSRTDDSRPPTPSTATFLERHGHSPMNLGVHVVQTTPNTQNGNRRRAESSPAPAATATAVTVSVPTTASTGKGKIPIRIVPAMDSFTRLPLRFDPIDRKVDDNEILVVGRHTDRLVTEHPSAIVFRSKVVSRNHAKMWSSNGQWYLQDVGSSSGTFLNHIRLSPPNVESTPYAIKDGDIVQLGIDFRVYILNDSRSYAREERRKFSDA